MDDLQSQGGHAWKPTAQRAT